MSAQPALMSERDAAVAQILARHQTREGALLPILHDVQAAFGYVPADLLGQIAGALNLSEAEVYGVVSFYHDFRDSPAGRHILRICRAEACQAVGGAALAGHARASLGLDWHQTTPDGRITLEPAFCLGLCACGPAAMIDGRPVARLDGEGLDQLIAGLV
ncbi:MAG: formate dehydrogenase subunit gamma [Paracoccus sp. (in: a-proteobacteria)]|nr:formate dehydrogenase subunit gamma [Paracoccus sp. (in: a-proteobacteria)]